MQEAVQAFHCMLASTLFPKVRFLPSFRAMPPELFRLSYRIAECLTVSNRCSKGRIIWDGCSTSSSRPLQAYSAFVLKMVTTVLKPEPADEPGPSTSRRNPAPAKKPALAKRTAPTRTTSNLEASANHAAERAKRAGKRGGWINLWPSFIYSTIIRPLFRSRLSAAFHHFFHNNSYLF